MKTAILKILIENQDKCKVGSDGDYSTEMCVFAYDFENVAEQIEKKITESYASQPSPVMSAEQFELKPCDKCLQLTNHIGNICQKCVAKMSAEQVRYNWQNEFYAEIEKYYPRAEHIPEIKDSVDEFQKIFEKYASSPSVKPDGWISVEEKPKCNEKFGESDYYLCKDENISGTPFVAWYNNKTNIWVLAHHAAPGISVDVTHYKSL